MTLDSGVLRNATASAHAGLCFRNWAGDCMFGLLEGQVQLSWNGEEGHELINAGDVFGAGALVTSEHRRYGNAKALSRCRLLVMNREKFLFAVQESPMFAIELLGSVDQRLRQLKDCTRI